MPRSLPNPGLKRDRVLRAQLADLNERLEASEQRHRQLHNTVTALGREVGVSVGSPCGHCNESYMLIKRGCMYCPRCGHSGAV
ncbi:hypothetical protein [Natrinema sp. 1APR25-10V2]|uniref:hypothetical protein n=1 Tax=Natrinema sp. 1APR25-10V2 TaxID=2951081 RepID=UPI0028756B94|nr:hypothetical protein [Natrinema sp. 1APR25-10V2]MDS0477775.1 hypothetical protein [Natrinema sp. 1APR25-10V2]